MLDRPSEERRGAKITYIPESAINEIKVVLGCKEYEQSVRSRTVDLTIEEHPCYAGLGALSDFHDKLLIFAYDRQIACDPVSIPYYLECLQIVAMGRNSDELQTKAAIESTQDRMSLKDIRTAYQHLGIDLRDSSMSDDIVIGTFNARLSDAPKQEAELRTDLKIIGLHRSSEKIKLVASQGESSATLSAM